VWRCIPSARPDLSATANGPLAATIIDPVKWQSVHEYCDDFWGACWTWTKQFDDDPPALPPQHHQHPHQPAAFAILDDQTELWQTHRPASCTPTRLIPPTTTTSPTRRRRAGDPQVSEPPMGIRGLIWAGTRESSVELDDEHRGYCWAWANGLSSLQTPLSGSSD
jgi:hypothetical protein